MDQKNKKMKKFFQSNTWGNIQLAIPLSIVLIMIVLKLFKVIDWNWLLIICPILLYPIMVWMALKAWKDAWKDG